MLKRLLATSVVLAVLACTATVGFEAVGLLFQFGQHGSARGTDVFLAPIMGEAPEEVPSEMDPDLPQLTVDGESKDGDVEDRAGRDGHEDERVVGAVEDKLGQDASAKAEAAPPRPEVERELPPRPVQEPKAYAASVIAAPGALPDCSEPCAPDSLRKSLSSGPQQPAWRPTKTERGKPVRSTASGYRSLGWPVLDWLDAALASALGWDAGPEPAGRRAAL